MKNRGFLSGNALKLIACVSMTFDHCGLFLLPGVLWPRVIGRIGLPIFAFMIAEGCFYTRNRARHFLTIAGAGVLMQTVLWLGMKTTDFTVFIHFSFSVLLIYLLDRAVDGLTDLFRAAGASDSPSKFRPAAIAVLCAAGFVALTAALWIVCGRTTYFKANYGFWGIAMPVAVFAARKFGGRFYFLFALLALALCNLPLLKVNPNIPQEYAFLALPLLLCYNGRRGKLPLKYFFYLFYPLHMIVIYAIYLLVR